MKKWFKMQAVANDAAEISVFDEIGMWGVTAKDFIGELRGLKAKSITLSINSPGGSVFDAIAMYNALRNSGAEITVRVLGVAASAASMLAMAGDKIVMPENSFMMIHNPMTGVYGNADEMRETADVLDKIGDSIVAMYVARSGKSEDEVKALLDAETWLNAADAVALGFADEMEASLKVAAAFDVERLPENVRAAYEAVDEDEQTESEGGDLEPEDNHPLAFADDVKARAEAAGLSTYAAVFALAHSDMPAVESAIGAAREIVSLCAVANKPDLADNLIRANKSVADARAALLDALAKDDEDTQTDGRQPADSKSQTGEQPAAGVKTATIWAARRKH